MMNYKYGKLKDANCREFLSAMIPLDKERLTERFKRVFIVAPELSCLDNPKWLFVGSLSNCIDSFPSVLAEGRNFKLIEVFNLEYFICYTHPDLDVQSMRRAIASLEKVMYIGGDNK